MKKNLFITGTLWLTGAGLFSRILGFLYRIYLSNLVGAEGMGLYQLIVPVYFLFYTLSSSGIQSAISRLVAEQNASRQYHNMFRIVFLGMIPTVLSSIFFSSFLYWKADFVACSILGDERAVLGLRVLCLSLPFCAVSACCKSFFHGTQQMMVPATEQVWEQGIRIGVILLLAPTFPTRSISQICFFVMLATVAGDIASCLYVVFFFFRSKKQLLPLSQTDSKQHFFVPLMLITLPITGSRVLTQTMACFENIILPQALERYGYTSAEALGLLGIFSGMVLPILLFPSVLTGSVSANLLPLASRAQATGNYRMIHRCIDQVLRFTFLLSFLCTAILSAFGETLGLLLYQEPLAGILLTLLSFFCPFIYLQGTLGGLLYGLGLQNSSLIYQVIGNALVILSILLFVPQYGLPAFLAGYLLSLLVSTLFNLHKIFRTFGHRPPLFRLVLLPLLACGATALTLRAIMKYFIFSNSLSLILLACSGIFFYLLVCCIDGAIQKKDLLQILRLFR